MDWKVKTLLWDWKFYILGGIVLLAVIFFGGEALYDGLSSRFFWSERGKTLERAEKAEKEAVKWQELALQSAKDAYFWNKEAEKAKEQNEILREANEKQAILLEQADSTLKKKAEEIEKDKDILVKKLDEINQTPDEDQLKALCAETSIKWDFCK